MTNLELETMINFHIYNPNEKKLYYKFLGYFFGIFTIFYEPLWNKVNEYFFLNSQIKILKLLNNYFKDSFNTKNIEIKYNYEFYFRNTSFYIVYFKEDDAWGLFKDENCLVSGYFFDNKYYININNFLKSKLHNEG